MSIKSNIFYNVSLSAANVLFPIITTPYISRVLGVENIGVVRFVITSVSYFSLFAALGIGYYGVRELAKYKDNQEKCSQIFSSLFTITLCSTLAVTLLFILCINLIPEFRKHRLLFSLYGITLYLVPITIDWYFQAKENFRMITIRSFVVKLLAFASLFLFVRERNDIVPYILISTFAIIAAQIWNLSYAYKTGLRINLRQLELRRHINPMFVFMCSNVSVGIFTMIDTVILGLLSSYEQVGYYSSANILITTMMTLFGAINVTLLPRLSFNNAQKNDTANLILLQKAFDLNILFVIPVSIGLCLSSSHFVPLFFGEEFTESIVPMQILSFKVILGMINSLFAGYVLMVFGHEKKVLLTVFCTALLSLLLNLLFIPHFGATGAAVIAIIAESFHAGFSLYFVYKITQIRIQWNTMKVASLFSLPFLLLYYFCNKFITQNLLFLCVFVCFSATVYFTLQLLTKNYLIRQIIDIGINRLKKIMGSTTQ